MTSCKPSVPFRHPKGQSESKGSLVQRLETSNSPRYFSPNILSSSCSLIMRSFGSMEVAAHLAYAGAQDAHGDGTDWLADGEVFGEHRGDGEAHGTS